MEAVKPHGCHVRKLPRSHRQEALHLEYSTLQAGLPKIQRISLARQQVIHRSATEDLGKLALDCSLPRFEGFTVEDAAIWNQIRGSGSRGPWAKVDTVQ